MRTLKFKYSFEDSLVIPEGATEKEIDELIEAKMFKMATEIRDQIVSPDAYTIIDSNNEKIKEEEIEKVEDAPVEPEERTAQKRLIGIKNITPVDYDGPSL